MNKTFDCIKMKEEIQKKLRHRFDGMTAKQMSRAIRAGLSVSQSPVGRFWRRLEARDRAADAPLVACEQPGQPYSAG